MKGFLVLLLSCGTAFAQVPAGVLLASDAAASFAGCNTNFVVPTFITNLSSTVDTTSYTTPAFTPSSNALIVAACWLGATSISSVANTGTSNLTWWRTSLTNISASHVLQTWVTQLPLGMSPFSMTVTATVPAGTGAEIHIYEVANANQSALWGTNAIVQSYIASSTGSTPDAKEYVWNSTACGSNAVMVSWGYASTAQPTGYQSAWTVILESGHTALSHRFITLFHNASVTNVPNLWITNSPDVSRMFVMMEAR
jgi:hypothetical protein